MSAVPTNKKRARQSASKAFARHSGEGRNPVCLASPRRDGGSVDGSAWKELRLDEAVEIIRGITFPSGAKAKVPSSGSIACLRTANVQREVEWDDLWYVARSFVKRDSQFVRERDILISNANSYELVGKVAFIRNVPVPATLGTFITLFRTRAGNDSRFIYFQLSSPEVQAAVRSMASTTTNISNISTAKLAQIVLRFPPLSKQREIVSEIEKQFTRLDAGVAALRRVQANLKRYRAAVLKAACEGRLVPTEAELAKAEGRAFETGEQLLARILADRRKNWHGRGKYKEPAAPDATNLPPLPEGWAWAAAEQLAAPDANSITDGPFGSNLKTAHYTDSGPRVVRLQNIGDGIFVDEYAHISEDHFARLQKHRVEAGDLLIAALGENLPRSCISPSFLGSAIVKADCIRLTPHPYVLNRFINTALNSEPVRKRTAKIVHGVGRPRLNLGEIKAINVPLPPLVEQARIAAEVERRLSVIEELEAAVSADLQRATRLRQSILQRAFTGAKP